MQRFLLPLSVLLAFTAAICAADDKPAAKADPAAVRQLVEQLKSDDYQTREKATRELSKLEQVPDELRAATKSDDLEQRRRALSAADAITARAEDKAFKEMVADLQKVELDRFVSRMVKDADFAGDKQWEVVETLTKALTKRANELSDKKYPIPDLKIKALPQQNNDAGMIAHQGKRILLSDPKAVMVSVTGCVILSAGPTPRMTSISDSIVIVDGDFQGATTVDNCLLIVRGNVGQITGVRGCVILATGEFERATGCDDCFFQVKNKQLLFTSGRNNVYVKSTPERPNTDKNGRVLDTDRGPLQTIKFSETKKDEKPQEEKK
jgi:hypothetical protein